MQQLQPDAAEIAAAIARIPSGCSILTVAHDGVRTGVLVSWVQQAAFEPLCITVCLKRGRPAGPLIDGAGRFLLNVVGEDPTALFKHFGKGFTLQEDAFAGLALELTDFGPLLTDCHAQLGCRVLQKVPVGDHDLYVAEVTAARLAQPFKPYVHLRKTAAYY